MDMSRLWAQRAMYETALKIEEDAMTARHQAYRNLEISVWETVYNFTGRKPEEMSHRHMFLNDDGIVECCYWDRKKKQLVELKIDIKNNEIRYA